MKKTDRVTSVSCPGSDAEGPHLDSRAVHHHALRMPESVGTVRTGREKVRTAAYLVQTVNDRISGWHGTDTTALRPPIPAKLGL